MNCYDYYITPEEYKKAATNGVCKKLLESRIRVYGWNKDRAINTPPRKFKKTDQYWLEIARENGISYHTFKYRISKYGWNIERAATQPII